jgi:hypothetical protein
VFRQGHEHAGGHVARSDTVTTLLRCDVRDGSDGTRTSDLLSDRPLQPALYGRRPGPRPSNRKRPWARPPDRPSAAWLHTLIQTVCCPFAARPPQRRVRRTSRRSHRNDRRLPLTGIFAREVGSLRLSKRPSSAHRRGNDRLVHSRLTRGVSVPWALRSLSVSVWSRAVGGGAGCRRGRRPTARTEGASTRGRRRAVARCSGG